MIPVVMAIIEDAEGRVLLAQRPPGKKHAGLWEFPGGKVEAGESLIEALHRELAEELSLKVQVQRELGAFIHHYGSESVALHAFVVRALNQPLASQDVQVFKWTAAGQIDLQELVAADREPLAAYLNEIG